LICNLLNFDLLLILKCILKRLRKFLLSFSMNYKGMHKALYTEVLQGLYKERIENKFCIRKKIMMFPYVDRESNTVSPRKGKLSLILVILFVHIICSGMGCMN
jgi:hypothetical protein